MDFILRGLKDMDADVRFASVSAKNQLDKRGNETALEMFMAHALEKSDAAVRIAGMLAMKKAEHEGKTDIKDFVKDDDPWERYFKQRGRSGCRSCSPRKNSPKKGSPRKWSPRKLRGDSPVKLRGVSPVKLRGGSPRKLRPTCRSSSCQPGPSCRASSCEPASSCRASSREPAAPSYSAPRPPSSEPNKLQVPGPPMASLRGIYGNQKDVQQSTPLRMQASTPLKMQGDTPLKMQAAGTPLQMQAGTPLRAPQRSPLSVGKSPITPSGLTLVLDQIDQIGTPLCSPKSSLGGRENTGRSELPRSRR